MTSQKKRVVEWDVYYSGKCMGTVFARTEDEARLAAMASNLFPEDVEVDPNRLSVNSRS